MTRRMIDSSMWLNEKFAELPAMARLLQIGIINHADDQGRIKATPAYLKARIFPYDDIDSDDIQGWLELMERNGTIILHIHDGKQHLQLVNWWEYQSPSFAAPSDIPKPQGWSDRIRITTKGRVILTCNWITSDKVLLQSTCDEQGRPINLNGKPPATPVQPSDDMPPNHMVEHMNDHMVDHVTTNINEYENKEKIKTTPPRVREAVAGQTNGGGGGGGEGLRQTNKDFGEICTAIEANGFGMMTQILSDDVQDLLKEYPSTWILDAMKVAVTANKRTMRYVSGILRRWRADGRDPPATHQAQAPPAKVDYAIAGML